MVDRQTLIALRARQTAYRIAAAIFFRSPAPPHETYNPHHDDRRGRSRRERKEIEEFRGWLTVTAVIAAMLATVVALVIAVR